MACAQQFHWDKLTVDKQPVKHLQLLLTNLLAEQKRVTGKPYMPVGDQRVINPKKSKKLK